jgi:hypothetical protein
MSYTESQARDFRDEMSNYQDNGWTPKVGEFLANISEDLKDQAREWYNDQGYSANSPSIEEQVRWGDAPDYMLDGEY